MPKKSSIRARSSLRNTYGQFVKSSQHFSPCKVGTHRSSASKKCVKNKSGSKRTKRTKGTKPSSLSRSSTYKPCKEGSRRSRKTNRCRKIKSTSKQYKQCPEGSRRSRKTNRCRKVKGAAKSPEKKMTPQEYAEYMNLLARTKLRDERGFFVAQDDKEQYEACPEGQFRYYKDKACYQNGHVFAAPAPTEESK